MKLALASILAIAAVAPVAVAQGNVELSGAYSHVDGDAGDLGAITARGTYFFNRYLGAEAEASFGIDDTNVGPATVELDNSFGGFGVLRAPVADRFELFGRVGYATTSFSASAGRATRAAKRVRCRRQILHHRQLRHPCRRDAF